MPIYNVHPLAKLKRLVLLMSCVNFISITMNNNIIFPQWFTSFRQLYL